jgi:hypothetical protein
VRSKPLPSVALCEFYASRAQAASVSQGRSSPRRLSRSARAKAAFPLRSPAIDNQRSQDRLRLLEAQVDFSAHRDEVFSEALNGLLRLPDLYDAKAGFTGCGFVFCEASRLTRCDVISSSPRGSTATAQLERHELGGALARDCLFDALGGHPQI